MSDHKKLNEILVNIADLKNQLAQMTYNDKGYDELEDDLHDLEDDFMDEYDEYLTDILGDIHEEYCDEDDVLAPSAYIAKEYLIQENKYTVRPSQGVEVDVDQFPEGRAKLVLVPNPVRFVLNMPTRQVIVWVGE